MRVVIELDKGVSSSMPMGRSTAAAGASGLDSAMIEQFTEIQKKLMGLLESQGSRDEKFLSSLRSQQGDLISAMERLVGSKGSAQGNDELLEAIQGLKRNTTMSMPKELLSRFDSMEAAITEGMKKSRSRTFGSNY